MITDSTEHASSQVETDVEGERLELAATIYELYSLGLIAEEIDGKGTPRFRVTGLAIAQKSNGRTLLLKVHSSFRN